MNNEQQSEQQKAIRRFYWEFLLHYCALQSLIYFLLQWITAQMTWYGYFFILFYRIYT